MVLLPEDVDDLWALYMVVEPGDLVRARTTREKKAEALRSKRGKRVLTKLGIEVEKKAFDALMKRLRLLGVIREAPEDFEDDIGKHHTISLRPGTPVEVQKGRWARFQKEIISRACSGKPKPLLVLCLDDEDYCVALVGMREVEILSEGRNTASGRKPPSSKEEALKPFMREALQALRRAWEAERKPIAIIGPTLERNLLSKLLREEDPELARDLVALRTVSTGGLPGVYEALRAGVLAKALSRARITHEAAVVKELLNRLGKNDERVAYGLEDVRMACSLGAVEILLISDVLLREAGEEERVGLEELMMEVEAKGGRVMIVSSGHEAGRNLLSLGGIAALLRFPLGGSFPPQAP